MRGSAGLGSYVSSAFLTLYFLGILNVFLRNSLGVIGPEIAVSLAIEPVVLGGVASAFFFAYALMQIPTGVLLDRYGARPTLGSLMVLTTAGALLFAAATSQSALLLSRILMGAGCAGCFTGTFYILARRIPRERFAFHGGLFNSIAMTGTLLAATPLAGATALLGWRGAALLMAGMAGAALLLVWTVLRDPPHPAAVASPAPTESLFESIAGMARIARIPGMPRLVCTGVGMSAAPVISGIWGGPYLHDVQGLDEISRGNVLLFMASVGVVSHFVLGQMSARFGSVRGVVAGGTILVIAALGVLATLDKPPAWLAALLFGAISFGCGYPALVHAHIRAMVPERLIGRGMTLITMGVMGIVAVMQLLAGAIIDSFPHDSQAIAPQIGYQVAFAVMALLSGGALLLYWRIHDVAPTVRNG